MAGSPRIDELRKKFDENPRRYFAPLANEYRKMGDFEQAIFICQEFLPQQPGHMSGHIVYGQALFEAGRHDEARAVFETALGLDPENLIALRHLGDIALARGDSTTARAWYQRVLDADPRNEEIAGVLQSIDQQVPATEVVAAAPPQEAPAEPAVELSTGSLESEASPSEDFIERSLEAIPPESKIPDFAALVAQVRGEAPSPPPAEPELEPPAGGAHGDTLGHIAALEGLETTNAGAASQPPAVPAAESFDLDALFRTDEPPPAQAAPAPPTEPRPASAAAAPAPAPTQAPAAAAAQKPTAPAADFANAALDLSDSSPFPAAPASGAFVTETMAELFLRQGHRDQALGVYRQLLAARPDDPGLRAKVRELEQPAATAAPVARTGPTIREFLNALATRAPLPDMPSAAADAADASGSAASNGATGGPERTLASEGSATASAAPDLSTIGGSLDALFGGGSRESGAGASPLELAFSDQGHPIANERAADAMPSQGDSQLPGRPTKPAETELSLDHVFRRPTPASGSPKQNFSFDQFFSQQVQENADAPAAEPASESAPEGGGGDDIQQFNAWLEGLKKS